MHQLVAEFERVIAADVTHDVLVAPIATGFAGVSPYLAADYVAADSFDHAVREAGAATPARALRVASQLAAALDAAAASNVVHGTLHPRDVLLVDDDVRLTGIGVAKALEKIGITAPVRRPYTAPERVAGREWDRRADVYSLAALMHELLWGKRVSGTGDQAVEPLTDVNGGDLRALKRAFARALADNHDYRYQTAGEFFDALKDALPGVRVLPPAAARRRAVHREIEPRLPLDVVEQRTPPAPAGDDFDLDIAAPSRAADDDRRFADIDIAPPLVEPNADVVRAEPSMAPDFDIEAERESEPEPQPVQEERAAAVAAPPQLEPPLEEREPLTVLDRSRSAVWPLILALTVGVALGFAGGFGFNLRQAQTPASPPAAAPPAPATGGREFTEGTIPAAPKGAAPAPKAAVPAPNSVAPAPKAAAAPVPEARPKRETPKPPIVPRPDLIGRLLVRSTPSGARVFVDNRDVGRTPASVRDVAVGAHRVRVTQDGYNTEERSVTITRRQPTLTMAITLKRPPARGRAAAAPPATAPARAAAQGPGELFVDSRPAGAKVYLDGTMIGTTPMTLSSLAPGEHSVRLEHEGYRQWTSRVRITAGQKSRVTGSLER